MARVRYFSVFYTLFSALYFGQGSISSLEFYTNSGFCIHTLGLIPRPGFDTLGSVPYFAQGSILAKGLFNINFMLVSGSKIFRIKFFPLGSNSFLKGNFLFSYLVENYLFV